MKYSSMTSFGFSSSIKEEKEKSTVIYLVADFDSGNPRVFCPILGIG